MPTAEEVSDADLLTLAIADPDRAEVIAKRLVTADATVSRRSFAHHALGIVLRERGHLEPAIAELRHALRLAREASDPDREADVRATLGNTLAMSGRTRSGLEQLSLAAAAAVDPSVRAKVAYRQAYAQYFFLTDARGALETLDRALRIFRRLDEPVWLARTLNLVSVAQLALGRAPEAATAIREAESIFLDEGQAVEALITVHNRGVIAFCTGDLPEALRLYDEAERGHVALQVETAQLVFDQSEALLAAGLATDASELITARLQEGHLGESQRAELRLRQATADLAAGDVAGALASAEAAHALFRHQRRELWAARAELAVVLAQERAGPAGPRLAARASAMAVRLENGPPEEAVLAWLVAGRLATAVGRPGASALLNRAAAYREHSSDLVRATAWQAKALAEQARGDRRAVLAACRHGLDSLDAHRATLGSSELRALATRHGEELARVALRQAVRLGPRALLEWSERWRAAALSQPPVHPPDDDELARALAALRDNRRRLAEAQAEGSPTAARLEEDRIRLERVIRQRAHHLRGTAAASTRFAAGHLVDALDGAAFVELVDVDGVLHALVARGGRVRHVVVGSTSEAEQAVPYAQFVLRQAARGRPADLPEVGRRLQDALLGDAVRALGAGPVVVSPTARLHGAPWPLLPALADVPVSVTPSAALWLRARSAGSGAGARVLVAGPGLESGGAEIDVLAGLHPEAVLLKHGAATVARTLEALDGAAVAHVAAHGRFRDDSPMFSSLDLDDGPLTVHDFERLERAPYRMVLSACESGVMAPIGAGELLGLVAAMLSLGSAGVVSSVARVNDQATAELMVDVHEAIDDGVDVGEVLLRARQAARGDRVHEATAAAFLAMGA